ncbi:RNA-binding protein 28 [Toxorhynchites rutilus septentrionalis]|uniref:RNA-binding protein 28 n=1 Tax=Toxorhynchites rutilus septentrionalis TaxID=329112 RepID=UPI00247A687D|nr:RNA-binding protein 28 [Toxorhynchites rutilus septentrionalis]
MISPKKSKSCKTDKSISKGAPRGVENKQENSGSNGDLNRKAKLSKNATRVRSREYAHRQCRLIIRNLSYKITEKKLRVEFEKYGTLEEVSILKRPDGKLVGCAFIQYAKREESDRAVDAMNNNVFMGRKIELCYALHKETYSKIKKNTDTKKEEVEESDAEVKEEKDFEKMETDADCAEDSILEDTKPTLEKKQNHTEIDEGRTVFLKNVPYDATDSDLKDIMSQFGIVEKVHINKERISGHSKGTAFVIFKLSDSAEMSLRQSYKIQVNNQFIEIVKALKKKEIREQESIKTDKTGKDSRNLYLLKEGLIMAGSAAAQGVSKTDMAQRLRLEQRNSQVLKNLNRFVAKERLTIHNIPENYTNGDLHKMVQNNTGFKPLECRVMRENCPSFGNPSGKSRGYGFLSFKKHEIALEVLRKLNNNPSIFGANNRPIVAFSIEDRNVHNIKQQRLLKSRLNNPTYQQKMEKIRKKKAERNLLKKEQKKTLNDQLAIIPNTSISAMKVSKKQDVKTTKKERKRKLLESTEDFTGEISRQGRMGIRSNRKINSQADAHMARLKAEKKEARKKLVKREHERNRKLKASRRIKPKQTKSAEIKKEDQYFLQTVGKYKTILSQASNKNERSKWYSE